MSSKQQQQPSSSVRSRRSVASLSLPTSNTSTSAHRRSLQKPPITSLALVDNPSDENTTDDDEVSLWDSFQSFGGLDTADLVGKKNDPKEDQQDDIQSPTRAPGNFYIVDMPASLPPPPPGGDWSASNSVNVVDDSDAYSVFSEDYSRSGMVDLKALFRQPKQRVHGQQDDDSSSGSSSSSSSSLDSFALQYQQEEEYDDDYYNDDDQEEEPYDEKGYGLLGAAAAAVKSGDTTTSLVAASAEEQIRQLLYQSVSEFSIEEDPLLDASLILQNWNPRIVATNDSNKKDEDWIPITTVQHAIREQQELRHQLEQEEEQLRQEKLEQEKDLAWVPIVGKGGSTDVREKRLQEMKRRLSKQRMTPFSPRKKNSAMVQIAEGSPLKDGKPKAKPQKGDVDDDDDDDDETGEDTTTDWGAFLDLHSPKNWNELRKVIQLGSTAEKEPVSDRKMSPPQSSQTQQQQQIEQREEEDDDDDDKYAPLLKIFSPPPLAAKDQNEEEETGDTYNNESASDLETLLNAHDPKSWEDFRQVLLLNARAPPRPELYGKWIIKSKTYVGMGDFEDDDNAMMFWSPYEYTALMTNGGGKGSKKNARKNRREARRQNNNNNNKRRSKSNNNTKSDKKSSPSKGSKTSTTKAASSDLSAASTSTHDRKEKSKKSAKRKSKKKSTCSDEEEGMSDYDSDYSGSSDISDDSVHKAKRSGKKLTKKQRKKLKKKERVRKRGRKADYVEVGDDENVKQGEGEATISKAAASQGKETSDSSPKSVTGKKNPSPAKKSAEAAEILATSKRNINERVEAIMNKTILLETEDDKKPTSNGRLDEYMYEDLRDHSGSKNKPRLKRKSSKVGTSPDKDFDLGASDHSRTTKPKLKRKGSKSYLSSDQDIDDNRSDHSRGQRPKLIRKSSKSSVSSGPLHDDEDVSNHSRGRKPKLKRKGSKSYLMTDQDLEGGLSDHSTHSMSSTASRRKRRSKSQTKGRKSTSDSSYRKSRSISFNSSDSDSGKELWKGSDHCNREVGDSKNSRSNVKSALLSVDNSSAHGSRTRSSSKPASKRKSAPAAASKKLEKRESGSSTEIIDKKNGGGPLAPFQSPSRAKKIDTDPQNRSSTPVRGRRKSATAGGVTKDSVAETAAAGGCSTKKNKDTDLNSIPTKLKRKQSLDGDEIVFDPSSTGRKSSNTRKSTDSRKDIESPSKSKKKVMKDEAHPLFGSPGERAKKSVGTPPSPLGSKSKFDLLVGPHPTSDGKSGTPRGKAKQKRSSTNAPDTEAAVLKDESTPRKSGSTQKRSSRSKSPMGRNSLNKKSGRSKSPFGRKGSMTTTEAPDKPSSNRSSTKTRSGRSKSPFGRPRDQWRNPII